MKKAPKDHGAPMILRMTSRDDEREVEVHDWADASAKFREWIDENGYGMSQLDAGSGDIMQGGELVARVSYNGRVWGPEKWTQQTRPIWEPGPYWKEAASRGSDEDRGGAGPENLDLVQLDQPFDQKEVGEVGKERIPDPRKRILDQYPNMGPVRREHRVRFRPPVGLGGNEDTFFDGPGGTRSMDKGPGSDQTSDVGSPASINLAWRRRAEKDDDHITYEVYWMTEGRFPKPIMEGGQITNIEVPRSIFISGLEGLERFLFDKLAEEGLLEPGSKGGDADGDTDGFWAAWPIRTLPNGTKDSSLGFGFMVADVDQEKARRWFMSGEVEEFGGKEQESPLEGKASMGQRWRRRRTISATGEIDPTIFSDEQFKCQYCGKEVNPGEIGFNGMCERCLEADGALNFLSDQPDPTMPNEKMERDPMEEGQNLRSPGAGGWVEINDTQMR
jgi:hypothetical protein